MFQFGLLELHFYLVTANLLLIPVFANLIAGSSLVCLKSLTDWFILPLCV